jgi:hypothetical protein
MDHQEYMSCVEADAPSVLLKEHMQTVDELMQERQRRVNGEEPEKQVPWDSGTVKFVEDAILWEMSQIEQCWDAVRNHNDSWLEQKQYEEWAEEMEAQEARRQWEASH